MQRIKAAMHRVACSKQFMAECVQCCLAKVWLCYISFSLKQLLLLAGIHDITIVITMLYFALHMAVATEL